MAVALYTKRNKDDYERILDIYVSKSNNELPYINDKSTCKMLLLTRGTLSFQLNGSETPLSFKAPVVICLSDKDELILSKGKRYQATTIFFKPTVINDAFSYERLYQVEFDNDEIVGTTLYQDYLLIRHFVMRDGHPIKYSYLTDVTLANMTKLISNMERELAEQYDGYWPCRSRSYFSEILFLLNFCYSHEPDTLEADLSFTAKVIEYLNHHIDEKIDLDTLTKEFSVNRNALNKAFVEETGLTCLNYLLKIRMDLAKLWLTETEIPIAEIGRRLGYPDQNYFTKVFRKESGKSPTEYRFFKKKCRLIGGTNGDQTKGYENQTTPIRNDH